MSIKKVIVIQALLLLLILVTGTLIHVTSAESRYYKQLSLGEKYLLELDYEKAIVAFSKAIQIDPKNVESRLELAKAYIGLEKYEDAKLSLEEALEIGTNHAGVQQALENLLQLVQNETDEESQSVDVQPTEETMVDTVIPSATPEVAQVKYAMPLSKYRDYLLPDSDSRLLTKQEISELWIFELPLARNEIFARHGRVFQDEYTQTYFESKAWYEKNPDYNDTLLNDFEKQNVQRIQDYADTARKNFYPIEPGRNIDLNGDGILDEIHLDYTPYEYGVFRLTINDTFVEAEGENLDGIIYKCNIDASDPYKAIAITEAGPSDDYITYFFYYDGMQIHSMGEIGGGDHTIAADGSGILSTKERGWVLHTWFYPIEYRLTPDRRLEAIPTPLYTMKTIVKAAKQVPLQKSPTDPAVSVTLHPGEDALIYATDNKEWLLIVNQDGLEGWLSMEDYYELQGNDWTNQVFEGLNYAD
jgi:tetratricopeptide (TPR) repeat protein